MKKILLLLLIVSNLFADVIIYQQSIFYTIKKENIEIIDVKNKKIFFKNPDGRIESIYCATVLNILDSSNNSIYNDCREPSKSVIKEIPTEYIKRPIIGGVLIAVGSGMLLKSLDDKEIDVDEKRIKGDLRVAYTLLCVGGILVALGI